MNEKPEFTGLVNEDFEFIIIVPLYTLWCLRGERRIAKHSNFEKDSTILSGSKYY